MDPRNIEILSLKKKCDPNENLINSLDDMKKDFVTVRLRADTLKNSPVVHRRSRIEEILSRPEVAGALGDNEVPKPKHRPPSPGDALKSRQIFDFEVEDKIEKLSDAGSSSSDEIQSEILINKDKNSDQIAMEMETDNLETEKNLLGVQNDENLSPGPIKSPMKLSRKGILNRFRFSSSPHSSVESLDEWSSWERAKARVSANQKDSPFSNENITPILKIITDPGSKPTLHKKTVSFSRLPSESLIKNSADCVALMQSGHHFVKLRSNSRVYNRFYWFETSTNSLHWEPSKKDHMKAKIAISSIKEVRPGKATESFITSEISSHFPDEFSFSIIYGDYKNLDLIASSADEANIWITGLRCLCTGKNVEELHLQKDTRDTWLEAVFDSADSNADGFLDENESLELLKSLSDGIRETRIKQKLTELLRFKDDNRTRITRNEFVEVFKDVTTRPEIYFLLTRYASEDDVLSINDLQLFLETEQGVSNVSKEDCIKLVNSHEPSAEIRTSPGLGIDGFTKYLMSPECNIFSQKHTQVCQDMTQPLSHYFIAASHNTYLMEDQLYGPCSISAYVRALLRCCRCIELDCWDGQDGEPIIAHSKDSANTVIFQQAVEAINESAFKNSPYPVILCIENHCSVKQQTRMAEILNNVLKDQIYKKELDYQSEHLPSPEQLKYKFLIRSQKLPEDGSSEGGMNIESDDIEFEESPISPVKTGFSFKKLEEVPTQCKQHTVVRELSDLVSLCVSKRMKNYQDILLYQQKCNINDLTSIHEQIAWRIVTNQPEEFVNYSKRFLSRVFPNNSSTSPPNRQDSSNFNPQDFWNCGFQIASLNYQTPGLMMDINDGRFSMNGGCGFVLKPSIMRDEVAYFSAHSNDIIPGISPKTLHIKVISGQEFPKPRGGGAKGQVIDPYVLIELFGMPADCSEQRTRTAHDCGSGLLSAIFDESFEFHLSVPELALVRFVVLDDEFIGDEFIGQYTIPFDCLQPGYRHLRLRSIFDEPLENATLFVHIHVTDTYSIYPNTPLTSGVQAPGSPGLSPNSGLKLSKKSKPKKVQQVQNARKMRASTIRGVGIPKIDSLFQLVAQPLKDGMEIKEKLHLSLLHFKEICGLTALSSVKHCMRVLATRAINQNKEINSRKQSNGTTQSKDLQQPIKVVCENNGLMRLDVASSYVNDLWRKVIISFTALTMDAQRVLKESPRINQTLLGIQNQVLKQREQTRSLLHTPTTPSPSISGNKKKKKLSKKISGGLLTPEKNSESNFAWNCSVIRGHLDSLNSAATEAKTTLTDICQSAVDLELLHELESNKFKSKIEELMNRRSPNKSSTSSSVLRSGSNSSDSSISGKNVNNNHLRSDRDNIAQDDSETDSCFTEEFTGTNIIPLNKPDKSPVLSDCETLPVTTL